MRLEVREVLTGPRNVNDTAMLQLQAIGARRWGSLLGHLHLTRVGAVEIHREEPAGSRRRYEQPAR